MFAVPLRRGAWPDRQDPPARFHGVRYSSAAFTPAIRNPWPKRRQHKSAGTSGWGCVTLPQCKNHLDDGQSHAQQTDAPAEKKEAVVIKKYANRRLYNTETSTYVTLDDLAAMVRGDRDFVVYDAKTGDDLTHSVLTQIIVEQENRDGGQTLLPVPFLRQLIRFYDDSIGRMVPGYLQFSLENLAKEQEKFRAQFANAFSNPAAAFEAYQEQARKNMADVRAGARCLEPLRRCDAQRLEEGSGGVSARRRRCEGSGRGSEARGAARHA